MSAIVEAEAKLIHIGATERQLSELFNMPRKTVREKIVGRVAPFRPKGYDPKDQTRYLVREAAPFLCDPQVDIEALLKSLTPAKFPPLLSDAFWKGQKTRLEVEEKRGNLWSTERVVQTFGEAFKPCRMSIMMMEETVEQEHILTPEQRDVIRKLMDATLEGLRQALVVQFEDYVPAEDEHGPPLGNENTIEVHPESKKPFDDGLD